MNLKIVITLLGVAVSALAMPHRPAYSEVNVVRYINYGHDDKLENIGSQKPKEESKEVEDPKMHDLKDQQEEREEVQEVENKPMSKPDGAKRTVKCYTDKHDGYRSPNMRQQQQQPTTSNIDDQNEEQEEPAQEPAPLEETAFKEQAFIEDEKSEDKHEIYSKKKAAILDYKIHHPMQYKQQEKKQNIYNRVHGKPKYYRGSYKGEQQSDGEEKDDE